VSLGEPCDSPSDARSSLAASLGDQIAYDHTRINTSTFEELRHEFSDEEIVELASWLCFKFGSNVFGALMNLSPASKSRSVPTRGSWRRTETRPHPSSPPETL
jgi:hypothetical protein